MIAANNTRYHDLIEARKIKENRYQNLRDFISRCPTRIYPEHVDLFPPLSRQILDIRKVCRSLKSGKHYRYRVVVGVGCKVQGLVGLGVAKADTVALASEKAMREAKKNIIPVPIIPRGGGHGPVRRGMAKAGATRICVRPLMDGASVTCSKYGRAYCRLGNVTNILITTGNKGRSVKGKVASRLNYYTALHEALAQSSAISS